MWNIVCKEKVLYFQYFIIFLFPNYTEQNNLDIVNKTVHVCCFTTLKKFVLD